MPNFFSAGCFQLLSMGGITYTDFWDQALSANATQLGLNAAAIATNFGVGIEIDYEKSTNPNLDSMQAFIDAYRSVHPYDATGANPAARLTLDVAVGDRYLIDLNRHATRFWLTSANPVLDYANAMVPGNGQPTTDQWLEHVAGMPQFAPPVPPLAPARFTGALWLTRRSSPIPECTQFATSKQKEYAGLVQTVAPSGAGSTHGMLGYMFWAASTRRMTSTRPATN